MSATNNPALIAKGARAAFIEGKQAAPAPLVVQHGLVMETPSEGYDEDYAWIGDDSGFEEFVDKVNFVPNSDGTYSLVNKKYTAGRVIKRDDWNDDRVGGFGIRFREAGSKYNGYIDYLVTAAVISGTTYGASSIAAGAHFRTDHPARGQEGGTQSNLLTGAGTSAANLRTDLAAALAKFMTLKGEDGQPLHLGIMRVGMMVPAALLFTAREAVKAGIISSTSNVQFSDEQIDVWANPYLDADSTVDWYPYLADASMRGMLWQDREGLTLEVQDSAESDSYFEREEMRFKERFRGRAGYGKWQKIIKINNT